jgi:hypothetical protein
MFLEFIDNKKKSKVMRKMMMCTPYMSRELHVFKIIIIYTTFSYNL